MQAGVGVSDNYPSGPSGWGVAIAQMYATTDLDWFLKNNRKMAFEPGTESEYRSVDTQMLGMIIKKLLVRKLQITLVKMCGRLSVQSIQLPGMWIA